MLVTSEAVTKTQPPRIDVVDSGEETDEPADRQSLVLAPGGGTNSAEIWYPPEERHRSPTDPRPIGQMTPEIHPPFLLKSRIHAVGFAVLHELGRGVPGFYGPPAALAAHLHAAFNRR